MATIRLPSNLGANQNATGLGPQSLNVLEDMRGSAFPVEHNNDGNHEFGDDSGNNDESEWIDIHENDIDNDTFIHAARDLMDERFRGRAYHDTRSWAQRVNRMHRNWEPRIEEMYDAYLTWKYNVPFPQSATSIPTSSADMEITPEFTDKPTDQVESEDPSKYAFNIEVLDIYTLIDNTDIPRSVQSKSLAEALMLQGYIGNTPENPSIAISVRTLQLFHHMRARKPSFSVEAFAKVICDEYNMAYRRRYRIALSSAYDAYLSLKRLVEKRVAEVLGRSGDNWRVLNACTACNYELEDEPPMVFKRMFAIDANFSLKRMAPGTSRQEGDKRTFTESDYYLETEYVDQFADEVKSRKNRAPISSEFQPPDASGSINPMVDDSTDQDEDPALPTHDDDNSGCAIRWKAAASDEEKKMWRIFFEAGLFASACRHGLILWICDLIQSGELAKYPLAMVSKALEVLGDQWLMGYDIGCAFTKTIMSSSLGRQFQDKKCRCCVNAFHGYSHSYDCQKLHHPNVITGIGLEDLEAMERIFSSSNQLGSVTRYMTRYRRRVFIHNFFQQWDEDKYANLGEMLHNNYVQALRIIEQDVPALEHAKQTLNIAEGDLERWHLEEVEYFRTLGQEPTYDVHRMAYVDLLERYSDLCKRSESNNIQFMAIETPGQASSQTYYGALSQTRKKETECRFLSERKAQILLEITALECHLGIATRWTPLTPDYQQTVQYSVERDFHRALDRLQKLVVQRLFELHKLNLSFTGYKMRTHIAKALQARCKAIRNAVSAYNQAALKMIPPKPTLDWSKVSQYSFLEEFHLLRGTRQDIVDKRWTELAVRETIKQDLRIKRAREEIERCNIEIRRVITSILDEHTIFSKQMDDMQKTGHVLYGPVREFCERRERVNAQILSRLRQTLELKGFTGKKTKGTRKGYPHLTSKLTELSTSLDSSFTDTILRTTDIGQDNDDEMDNHNEDGDSENIEGDIGGLVDYISELPLKS